MTLSVSTESQGLVGESRTDEHRADQPSGPARILVVEDEHLVALDIQLRLELMGHSPVTVPSGEEAVRLASETQFDLVLMDIKLRGGLDGIEAARAIRNQRDIPIIYLTAYADNQTLQRARVTEPHGYLLKPFHVRELKASIEMALQRHRSDVRRWEQQELQRFLSDASSQMTGTLDYRAVALSAAELLVPRHADWCTIWLKDSTDDLVTYFAYTRPNGELESGSARAPALVEAVLRNGRSELVQQIADEQSPSDALGVHDAVALRALGAHSLMCAPIIARDQVLGAVVLVAGGDRPVYVADCLLNAEDFGHRLGVALDNALLYLKSEQAVRMRDDVLAIVSHDLRSPLSTILMQAAVVGAHPELHDTGKAIARNAARMKRLIGDLLDASSLNAGRLGLDRKVHPAGALLGEAVEMFRTQAESREIQLVAELPVEPAYIMCDRDRIVQVLSNLIGNALKFTERGGKVTARVERAPEGIGIEVRDTGIGIPPDQVPHLFERFWRARPQPGGAGLGLFIASGIVATHGSRLDVETAPGRGSRFFFVLPDARP